jgi:hypothetical protein
MQEIFRLSFRISELEQGPASEERLVMILKGYDTEKNRNVREPEDLMAACA